MSSFTTADVPSLSGRTVVVTGASGGVGRVTATVLAAKGARVILAVRSEEKGHAAAATMDGDTEVRRLDLADLSSVRAFAESLTEPIDVLINNAGISIPPLERTADGFESQFGTNHLGHFALTNLLLPQVRDRVVIIGSLAHLIGRIDFTDLNWHRRRYRPYPAYGQSKLANHLTAHELQRRLSSVGSSVISVVAHPGIATTNLMNVEGRGLRYRIERSVIHTIAQPAEAGALPSIYAAVAEIPGGSSIGPSRLMGLRGAPAPAKRAIKTHRSDDARRLWKESERLTGTVFPFDTDQPRAASGR
ncbi:oxidoreductase [Marinitenerispora sediminis]|uniref:Oxidoreductase n=1 Tax=Marinitenerispora sediminis TaxID=1931232 RepID=A0A368TA00_9ACTN|nr:oxidoreductase [Marinitenerispora sediminis]RCV52902.1 oxidoreductase [Marinitenerispora sediminis]RCV60745.1 oxidoreductase [Marinitenerispora sediminis]RCV61581.1 oxidoreductase [Marinitenerispora sediminis]